MIFSSLRIFVTSRLLICRDPEKSDKREKDRDERVWEKADDSYRERDREREKDRW